MYTRARHYSNKETALIHCCRRSLQHLHWKYGSTDDYGTRRSCTSCEITVFNETRLKEDIVVVLCAKVTGLAYTQFHCSVTEKVSDPSVEVTEKHRSAKLKGHLRRGMTHSRKVCSSGKRSKSPSSCSFSCRYFSLSCFPAADWIGVVPP